MEETTGQEDHNQRSSIKDKSRNQVPLPQETKPKPPIVSYTPKMYAPL